MGGLLRSSSRLAVCCLPASHFCVRNRPTTSRS